METELEVLRKQFASLRTGLAGEVDRGINLMEELLSKLGSTELELKQTKLDLDNERGGRRRLQQENKELKQRQERQPFLAALIDADADDYVFDEIFLAGGEEGGVDAADALLAALQGYARETLGFSAEIAIVVRAFANISGLGEALVRRGTLSSTVQLRAFVSGFNNRQALFDFMDVGPDKERADSKIRENTSFFVGNFQCKHLMLACGHDSGYAPFLAQFIGNKQVADRITLIRGRRPFPAAIQKLEHKTTQFDSVFKGLSLLATSPQVVGTVWGRTTAGPKAMVHDTQNEHSNEVKSADSKAPIVYTNPAAQSMMLGPVVTDGHGRRVDKELRADKVVIERIKKGGLCYHLYLRGECITPASEPCGRNHVFRPLSDDEFAALWWLARQAYCFRSKKARRNGGNDCSDERCIYGHKTST